MRTIGFLSAIAVVTCTAGACGLSVQGLDSDLSDGGGHDGSSSGATTSSSSGSSGGSSSGGSSGSGSSGSGSSGAGSSGGGSSGSASSSGSSGGADATTGSDASEASTQPESSVPDVTSEPPPQETGGGCTTAQGCYVIPGGWSLVGFAQSQGASCPSGFSSGSPVNVVAGPNTTNTCSCGTACNVDKQPDCQAGPVGVSYDVAPFSGGPGSCGTAGQPSQMNNTPPGGCGTDMYNGTTLLPYSAIDLEYTPANQLGGHCNAGAGVAGTVTFDFQDRACPPDNAQSAGCTGNQCTPNIPAPYAVCVVQSGSHACPGAPFTQQHVVGSGFGGVSCSACDCTVQGTCSGGTVKLYTSNNCSTGGGNSELDVTADGKCHSSNANGGTTYNSYKYVANAPGGVGCTPSGTSNPSGGALTNEETICCAP